MNNKPHTEEAKAKMSAAQKKLWGDPGHRRKMIKSLTGRKVPPRSEETSRKISIAQFGFYWGDRDFGTDKELQAFKGCHNRVKEGKSPSIFWPRDIEGFRGFLIEVGRRPDSMEKPSVGRIRHSLGYEPGNIQWEEHRINAMKRKGTKHEAN